jgi:hypothetical protein
MELVLQVLPALLAQVVGGLHWFVARDAHSVFSAMKHAGEEFC